MKRLASGIILTLLLVGMLTSAVHIQPVRAIRTIYIRADGSIDPPTAPISTVDNITYALTGNVSSDGNGIIVQKDNITLDVAGYLIRGVGNGVGVDLTGRSNVSLMNGNIRDFNDAVYLSNSQGNVIIGNNIDNVHGLSFWNSNNNTVSSNNVTSSSINLAFYFSSSSCNTIVANNVTNSSQAFRFETGSSNNTLIRNTLFGGATTGIQFWGGENNAAIENSVTSYEDGIEIYGAQNCLVSRNIVSGSGKRGIDVWGGAINNSVVGNNVTNCWYGIRCSGYGNTLFGNKLEDNGIGIGFELSSSGNENIASENRLLSNYYGIEFYQNNNSVCYRNAIMDSHYEGISVFQSYDNSIFHNSIVNNAEQVHGSYASNVWDDGYPSGGNYWSDYNGTDLHSGPSQNIAGSDGIGDTPYVIDSLNRDNYPLMQPGELRVDWWPMCQHDIQHTGWSSCKIPDGMVSIWNCSTTGDYCQPVVYNGVVYVGSGRDYPGLSAINETDGTILWNHPVGGSGITTSPAVCDQGIFAGSWGGEFYRFDFQGNVIWNFTTEIDRGDGYGHCPVWSSPAIDDGKVYFLTYGGDFYALNITNGDVVWVYSTPCNILEQSSPAICNGVIYFGSMAYGLRAVNETDGSEIWKFATGNSITAGPTVLNGRVYIGSSDSNFYCVNSTNGSPIWQFTANGPIYYGSAISGDCIYFSDYQGWAGGSSKLYSLNLADGSLVWNVTIDPRVRTDTIIGDGKVFVGGQNARVYAFNATNGLSVWNYNTTGPWFGSSFALADNRLFVGSDKLYVFGELATISPTSVIIDVGQSQTFVANVSGGTSPYSYQWYLDKAPVQGETNVAWDFVPTTMGSHAIIVKTIDGAGIQATSNTATVTVNTHVIAVTNVTCHKTVVGQGFCANVDCMVANLGNYTETFNVTVYANSTFAASQNVTLSNNSSLNIEFTWNTTDFDYGYYTMSACAWPVPGETNTVNNNFTDGWVVVAGPGDIASIASGKVVDVPDGKVDMVDVGKVARRFLISPSDPLWDSDCDITGPTPGVPDGMIDMRDIGTVAKHFGEIDP